MTERTFPIMRCDSVTEVPWSLAEQHRAQFEKNHYQTLERLAERGGLTPYEFVAGATGHNPFSTAYKPEYGLAAERWLHDKLRQGISQPSTPER